MCRWLSQLAICGWYITIFPPLGVWYPRGQPPSAGGAFFFESSAEGVGAGVGLGAGLAAGLGGGVGAGICGAAGFGGPGGLEGGGWPAARRGAAGDRTSDKAVAIATARCPTTGLLFIMTPLPTVLLGGTDREKRRSRRIGILAHEPHDDRT